MHRQAAHPKFGCDLGLGPTCQGIDLDSPVDVFDDLQPASLAAVEALATGNPGLVVPQSLLERKYLADVAAAIGIASMKAAVRILLGQVGHRRCHRTQVREP